MPVENKSQIIKYFEFLDNFYLFILGSQLILGITAFFIDSNGYLIFRSISNSVVIFSVIIIDSIAVFLSRGIYYSILRGPGKNIDQKFNAFRKGNIIKFLLFEAANITNLAAYLATADYLYIALFGIIILLMYAHKPRIETFIKDFTLTDEENKFITDISSK